MASSQSSPGLPDGIELRDLDAAFEPSDWRVLVDNVRDIIVVVDDRACLRYVSPSVQTVLGFDPAQLVGASLFETLEIEELPRYRELLEEYATGADVPDLTGVRVRAADGTMRILEITGANKIHDPRINGIILTARDVTERHLAMEQVMSSRAWAEALVQGGTELVVVIDAATTICYASPAAIEVLGRSPSDVIGSTALDLVHPDDRDTAIDSLAELLGPTQSTDAVVIRGLHADGKWRWLRANARNLLGEPAVKGIVLNISDVTDLVEARQLLERSEAWASTLIESGSDVVLVTDAHGRITYASASVREVLGHEPAEVLGRSALGLIVPEDRPGALAEFERAVASGADSGPVEYRCWHMDGSARHMSTSVTNLLENSSVRGVMLRGHDVTRRRIAEDLLHRESELLRTVARGLPLEVVLGKVVRLVTEQVHGAACYLSVVDADGVLRSRASDGVDARILEGVDAMGADSPLGRMLRAEGVQEVLFRDLPADERRGAIGDIVVGEGFRSCWTFCIADAATGMLVGTLVVLLQEDRDPLPIEREMSERAVHVSAIAIERAVVEADLQHKAMHDDLTALPNRNLLVERVEQALLRARRRLSVPAVLFVDLDRFKFVNDSRGHEVGDELLRQVASRLAVPLRSGDTLGRFGGDEFVLVCEDVGGEPGARSIATRLLEMFTEPFALAGEDLYLSASIGVAVAVDADVSADLLIRDADVAMFRAKERGRSRIEVFEESLRTQTVRRLDTEQALRLAVDRDELVVEYQPVVRLSDAVIVSFEALVRWDRPGHGRVQPDSFIPVAEESGLIVRLGRWVLSEACAEARRWPPNRVGEMLGVSVNLSARQLADPDLLDTVCEALTSSGLDASRLCLEVTESVLIHDADHAVATLSALRDLGVELSIDDFGTGYASLDYLRRFSMAHELKIDRSFVNGVAVRGSQEAAIVSASIAMASSLGLRVVAEGVQTPDQIDALRTFGCDLAQGYHFSRPVPAISARDLVMRTGPW